MCELIIIPFPFLLGVVNLDLKKPMDFILNISREAGGMWAESAARRVALSLALMFLQ